MEARREEKKKKSSLDERVRELDEAIDAVAESLIREEEGWVAPRPLDAAALEARAGPRHRPILDGYMSAVDVVERQFSRPPQTPLSLSSPRGAVEVDHAAVALHALACLRGSPETAPTAIARQSDPKLALRIYEFEDVVVVLDDRRDDYDDDDEASARYVADFIGGDPPRVLTGYARGARIAARVACLRRPAATVLFETSPHHVPGPDWTLYTGEPSIDNSSPLWKGGVDCHHVRLDIPPTRWSLRCAYGSATRTINLLALGTPLLGLARLTELIVAASRANLLAQLLATLRSNLKQPNSVDHMAALADALADSSNSRRRRVLRWPSFYDQLRDLAWDALRTELVLFHPANAGLHTILDPNKAHDRRLATRTNLLETPLSSS